MAKATQTKRNFSKINMTAQEQYNLSFAKWVTMNSFRWSHKDQKWILVGAFKQEFTDVELLIKYRKHIQQWSHSTRIR